MADLATPVTTATSDYREKQAVYVYGFIHQLQRLFPTDDTLQTMPDVVIELCVQYYVLTEYFEVIGNDLLVSGNDKLTIRKNRYQYNLFSIDDSNGRSWAFGAMQISASCEMAWRWDFKINHCSLNGGLFVIGIAGDTDGRHYYGCNGLTGSKVSNGNWNRDYNGKFKTGDIVSMEFNCPDRTLRYAVNGKDCGIAFANIGRGRFYTTYRLMVHLRKVDDGLTLTYFGIAHKSDNQE